jgi:hypothetical protein
MFWKLAGMRPAHRIKLYWRRRIVYAISFLHDVDVVHKRFLVILDARPLTDKIVCGLTHGQLCVISPFWNGHRSIQEVGKIFENEESTIMLWVILIVLLLLWLVGFYGGFVTTSLIHLLLVAAVVILALNLLRQHRNPA